MAGGRLNLKMATSPFTEEVTKMIEENTIWKSTKDVTKFGKFTLTCKIILKNFNALMFLFVCLSIFQDISLYQQCTMFKL